jgi:pimeloyl-ACP methyl ester carboxylesterase
MRNYPTLFMLLLCFACSDRKDHANRSAAHPRRVRIHGKEVYYEEYGKGTPLLILCGGGIQRSVKDFEKCIPGLSEHYRIIVADTPGQGKSEQPDSLTYAVIHETMSELIDALTLDSLYVMGWSDGGIVGILLAESRPDKVKKVIAVGPNNGKRGFSLPPGVPLDSVVAPSLEIYQKMNEDVVKNYSATPGRDWRLQVSGLNKMWYAEEYFSPSIYERIKIPVMIVLGDRDDISIEHGTEMYRSIKGSQFCVLPNTTHEVFTERPGLINQIAFDFFR